MTDVPVAIPVATPVLLTVATLVVAELQLPPEVAEVSAVVLPVQIVVVPVMADGNALTVNVAILLHPAPSE
jgi:hypothetical protein